VAKAAIEPEPQQARDRTALADRLAHREAVAFGGGIQDEREQHDRGGDRPAPSIFLAIPRA